MLRAATVIAVVGTLALVGYLFYRGEWASGIDVLRNMLLAGLPITAILGAQEVWRARSRE